MSPRCAPREAVPVGDRARRRNAARRGYRKDLVPTRPRRSRDSPVATLRRLRTAIGFGCRSRRHRHADPSTRGVVSYECDGGRRSRRSHDDGEAQSGGRGRRPGRGRNDERNVRDRRASGPIPRGSRWARRALGDAVASDHGHRRSARRAIGALCSRSHARERVFERSECHCRRGGVAAVRTGRRRRRGRQRRALPADVHGVQLARRHRSGALQAVRPATARDEPR